MTEHEIKQLVRDLEDMDTSLSAIARLHNCSPQFVSRAVREADISIGAKKADAVRTSIVRILGRNPWTNEGAAPVSAA